MIRISLANQDQQCCQNNKFKLLNLHPFFASWLKMHYLSNKYEISLTKQTPIVLYTCQSQKHLSQSQPMSNIFRLGSSFSKPVSSKRKY